MASSRVEASGNRVVLYFDSLEDAMWLLRPWRGGKLRLLAAEGIHSALGAAGLAMEVRVGGYTVVELGAAHAEISGPLMALLRPSATGETS